MTDLVIESVENAKARVIARIEQLLDEVRNGAKHTIVRDSPLLDALIASARAEGKDRREAVTATILVTLAAEASDADLEEAYDILEKHGVLTVGNISIGAVWRLACGVDGASGAEYRLARAALVFASMVVTVRDAALDEAAKQSAAYPVGDPLDSGRKHGQHRILALKGPG